MIRTWFWGPVVPLLALDLWSKAASFAFLAQTYPEFPPQMRSHEVWRGFVDFDLVSWRNTGTIWGLADEWTAVLMVLRCFALGLIVYFAYRVPRRAWLQQFVLGMILAGAIGNLYDNFTEVDRGVRDFLLFSAELGGEIWRFPAFNVADSCICVGAITLAIMLWNAEPEPQVRAAAPAQPSGSDSASRLE